MKSAQPGTEPLEGFYFELSDLKTAMRWAAAYPAVHLSLRLDDSRVPEVIQLAAAGSDAIRWCIWRDETGLLRLDDWLAGEFDMPCPTLTAALEVIAGKLSL